MIARLEVLYEAGEVKRLHTVPTLRHHSIAEHCYGAILIATELIVLNRRPAAVQSLALDYERIVKALMVHDAPEVFTGDVPAPVKRAADAAFGDVLDELERVFYSKWGISMPGLNHVEQDIVKSSDTLDLGYRCLMERRMGNRHRILEAVFKNVMAYAIEKEHIDGVQKLRLNLAAEWMQVGK